MRPYLLLVVTLFLAVGCSSLPPQAKEGEGVVILPVTFQNKTNLADSLVDIVLHFNNGRIEERFSPHNGYLVIVARGDNFALTGISISPKTRVSVSGGVTPVNAFWMALPIRPGQITISPRGLNIVQTRAPQSPGARDSYYTNWNAIALSVVEEEKLWLQLRRDANAKVWGLNEQTSISELIVGSRNPQPEASALTPTQRTFFEIVSFGDLAAVSSGLAQGASISVRNDNERTPLMVAAADNPDPRIIAALLAAGSDVAVQTPDGWTALHLAARDTPSADVVSKLLAAGASVEEQTKDGRTPLMIASGWNPSVNVLSTLLEAGASVNQTDPEGWTPLMFAASFGRSPEVVRALLKAGADGKATNQEGKTAFALAEDNQWLTDSDEYEALNQAQR